MADINRDLDRYLRRRRTAPGPAPAGDSLWNKLFSAKPKDELPADDLSASEMRKLNAMETSIKSGERALEDVQEFEHELEEEQEKRVSAYHKVLNLFRRENSEPEMETVELDPEPIDTEASEDFRKLAQIQVRWLERLPTRIKEQFKESEDYDELVGIYERHGVVRRR